MARIYVGTYAKYNAGNLHGRWMDLEDYSDGGEFFDACRALHADEEDPELMFQDFEDIPAGMVSESHLSDDVWEWLELDEHSREVLAVYRSEVNQEGDADEALEAFRGRYDSAEDYAQEYHEECGDLSSVPDSLRGHIDWESVARDMVHTGVNFVEHDGDVWVFVD